MENSPIIEEVIQHIKNGWSIKTELPPIYNIERGGTAKDVPYITIEYHGLKETRDGIGFYGVNMVYPLRVSVGAPNIEIAKKIEEEIKRLWLYWDPSTNNKVFKRGGICLFDGTAQLLNMRGAFLNFDLAYIRKIVDPRLRNGWHYRGIGSSDLDLLRPIKEYFDKHPILYTATRITEFSNNIFHETNERVEEGVVLGIRKMIFDRQDGRIDGRKGCGMCLYNSFYTELFNNNQEIREEYGTLERFITDKFVLWNKELLGLGFVAKIEFQTLHADDKITYLNLFNKNNTTYGFVLEMKKGEKHLWLNGTRLNTTFNENFMDTQKFMITIILQYTPAFRIKISVFDKEMNQYTAYNNIITPPPFTINDDSSGIVAVPSTALEEKRTITIYNMEGDSDDNEQIIINKFKEDFRRALKRPQKYIIIKPLE